MAETQNSSGPSLASLFAVLLTVLFIGLKLGSIITWSWWWVLAPLWGYALMLFSIFFIVFSVALIFMRKK